MLPIMGRDRSSDENVPLSARRMDRVVAVVRVADTL
jgi:hypothetical protein